MPSAPRLVVTHPGTAHFDEWAASALALARFEGLAVERREPRPEELADASVVVVDVGGRFEPEFANFDHHHDLALPAAFVLVADWLGLDLAPAAWADYKSRRDVYGADRAAASVGMAAPVRALDSPIEGFVLRAFGAMDRVAPGAWMHALMRGWALDLMGYLGNVEGVESRVAAERFVRARARLLSVRGEAVLEFREELTPARRSALGRLAAEHGASATITTDVRSGRAALYRSGEQEPWDFTRLEGRAAFAHKGGFLAVLHEGDDPLEALEAAFTGGEGRACRADKRGRSNPMYRRS